MATTGSISINEESSSSTVYSDQDGENLIITKEMEEEEKEMAEESAKEEKRVQDQYKQELKAQEDLEKQNNFKCLMHLLNQSQFYTNYLMKKIEESKMKPTKMKSENKTEINGGTVSSPNQAKKDSKKRALITDYIDHEILDTMKKRQVECDNILITTDEQVEEPVKSCINSMGLEVPEGQPKLLEGGVLRPYQLEGLNWMKALFENGVNGILADEMGLGKTIQVISLLCHLIEKQVNGPFLIIAPLSTLPNWMMEFERFAPSLPTLLFHGSKTERPKLYKKFRAKVKVDGKLSIAPIILTSYQIVLMEKDFMSHFQWRYIIVDEGHALKNEKSQISRCLRRFHSVNRMLLTGTPLQNNLNELWSLLNFLLPDIFDDHNMFQALFDIEAITTTESSQHILQQEAESHVLSTLHQILTPFLLRRLKTDVELKLPPKREVLVFCPLFDLQLNLYKATIDRVIEQLLSSTKEDDKIVLNEGVDAPRKKRKCAEQKKDYSFKDFDWFGEKTPPVTKEEKPEPKKIKNPDWHISLHMASPEMQLRKIANHPYLVQMPTEVVDGKKMMVSGEELITCSGKMMVLNAMLLKLHQKGHKVLIFSYFKIMLNLIEEFALLREYRYVRLDGDDTIENRKANIRTFNTDPDVFLFLITTRAGGLGLNLTSADTVIIFDSDYNPQVDLQAMDRCHRIGQTKPVMVYRFVSKGTVDEKILQMATGKRKLEKVVIKKGLFKLNAPPKKVLGDLEELKQLLESAEHCKAVQYNGLVFTDEELEELLDRSSEKYENKSSHFQIIQPASSNTF